MRSKLDVTKQATEQASIKQSIGVLTLSELLTAHIWKQAQLQTLDNKGTQERDNAGTEDGMWLDSKWTQNSTMVIANAL